MSGLPGRVFAPGSIFEVVGGGEEATLILYG